MIVPSDPTSVILPMVVATNLPFDDFVQHVRAPIERLFHCHSWCNGDWCWSRELEDREQKMMEHVLLRHDAKLHDDGGSSNEDSSVNVDDGDNNGENDAIFDSSRC